MSTQESLAQMRIESLETLLREIRDALHEMSFYPTCECINCKTQHQLVEKIDKEVPSQ